MNNLRNRPGFSSVAAQTNGELFPARARRIAENQYIFTRRKLAGIACQPGTAAAVGFGQVFIHGKFIERFAPIITPGNAPFAVHEVCAGIVINRSIRQLRQAAFACPHLDRPTGLPGPTVIIAVDSAVEVMVLQGFKFFIGLGRKTGRRDQTPFFPAILKDNAW